jgi:hypothetical protein
MKNFNALYILPALTVATLWFIPQAHGQTVPPPPPAATSKAPAASSQVTVTRSQGCVTVKVCPGPRCTTGTVPAPKAPPAPPAAPAPAPGLTPVPAPPPAAPLANRPAAPQRFCTPFPTRTYEHPAQTTAPAQLPKRKPLPDPARTRLGLSNTAEVLGHGQWEFLARELGALIELSVGLGDRFQLTFKTAPPTWFFPNLKFRDSLMAGEIRAQIIRSRRLKLTADASYFHVASFHGLKLGLKAKIGTDKLALHVGVGAVMLFGAGMASDTCAGPVAQEDGNYDDNYDDSYYDCGGGYETSKPVTILTANLGVEMRLWRYGKFFVDAFVAHMNDNGDNMTVFTLVPGMRFHSKGFAADVGIGVLGTGDIKIPLPVVNLSYRW